MISAKVRFTRQRERFFIVIYQLRRPGGLNYWEPAIGYLIQYDSDGNIEVEHLDDIKKEAPVLYREIKDLIDEEGSE